VFLVAYPKGRKPEGIQVQKEGTEVVISASGQKVRFDVDGKCGP
jgi:hypothetical protein